MGAVQRKCWLTFEHGHQKEPCLWNMSRKFPEVVFDIRQATIQEQIGIMSVLFEGEPEDIRAAWDYLERLGVKVDAVEPGQGTAAGSGG